MTVYEVFYDSWTQTDIKRFRIGRLALMFTEDILNEIISVQSDNDYFAYELPDGATSDFTVVNEMVMFKLPDSNNIAYDLVCSLNKFLSRDGMTCE